MRAPSQRRALGALFFVIAVGLAGIAYAAALAEQWVILAAAAVLAAWMGATAARALRPR